jgi:uncharacterized protein DUF3604
MFRLLRFSLATLFLSASCAAEPVTVFLQLGVNPKAVERWDGSAKVTGGTLLSAQGHQFFQGDRTTSLGVWRCSTRQDEIRGFPRVNYNEMSPAELPPAVYYPCGLFLTIEPEGAARVSVETLKGNFEFGISDLGLEPKQFLNGRARIQWAPSVERLTTQEYEDDEASIAALPDGSIAVAWVAYRERADRVMLRERSGDIWGPTQEVTTSPADLFRCSLAVDSDGNLWAFWSERDGATWSIRGRQRKAGQWQSPVTVSGAGSNTFHRAAASDDGTVHVTWQSFRGGPGEAQSDIYLRSYSNGKWSDELQVSTSPANDWEPFVAGGRGSTAHIVWDGYHSGNYDVFFRALENGQLADIQQVTDSEKFQAHANVAVDSQGRPWVAWDESGPNWGKDTGFLVTPAYGTPLHRERSIALAMWDGKQWQTPRETLAEFYPYRLFTNLENPQLIFDGKGTLNLILRHWRRARSHSIGAPIAWESYLTRFDGKNWTRPVPLNHSQTMIEKRAALTRDAGGNIWSAWMTDDRIFATNVPQNAEIYAAPLGASARAPSYTAAAFTPFDDPYTEAVPIHANEPENLRTIRGYTINAGDKNFKIYRGDMHRHTDISQDFKYDGSLIEVYRYALDAAGFDYMVPTDHQLGYDREFTWWQDEKLTDLFHVPGTFTPLFGYERSLTFPNGHRNVIFAKRGTRPLPIPADEARGRVGAKKLYEYLHRNDGISMPHSSGTAQGTDFRDNDPDVEPLIEIFQGYRASYEYQGAPLAASQRALREQRSGFAAEGYWWEALKKGLKLGVQASSDHWSTHFSYACIIAETFDRDGMFAALKARHAYAATDNIVLDFQAESAGRQYIMGDVIAGSSAPKLRVRAIGTADITQVVIVKNQTFVYTSHPNAREIDFEFIDQDFSPGQNYYYVRVVQVDRQVAWSSPIWIE